MKKLAKIWAQEAPEKIVTKLKQFETDANEAGRSHWPRWPSYLCEIISSIVDRKSPWIRALIDSNCHFDLIQPFLQKAAIGNEKGWIKFANECLENSYVKIVTISIVLTLPSPPEKLLKEVLSSIDDYGSWIETLCLRKEIPDNTLVKLLSHSNHNVSSKAAIGVWLAEPQGQIENKILKEWKDAILTLVNDDDYWLNEIFQKDHAIAFEWLKLHINDRPESHYTFKKLCEAAVRVLDFEHRSALLDIISEDFFSWDIVGYLIGNDIDLYRKLLAMKNHKDIHLAPLKISIENEFNEAWAGKTKAALEAGYSPEDIARSVRGYS